MTDSFTPYLPNCPRCGDVTVDIPCCPYGDRSACSDCDWKASPC